MDRTQIQFLALEKKEGEEEGKEKKGGEEGGGSAIVLGTYDCSMFPKIASFELVSDAESPHYY